MREAHAIVTALIAADIPAHAVEDRTGENLSLERTASEFNKPDVDVNRSDFEKARAFIAEHERKQTVSEDATNDQATSNKATDGTGPDDGKMLTVVCEDCGESTEFPSSMDGTTQDCPHCHGYVDVGNLPWEEDFGEPED